MTDQHTITPPPKLVEWLQDLGNLDAIALAYQAGADQELEACCEHVDDVIGGLEAMELRAARRPKTLSLKKQALALLDKAEDPSWDINDFTIVRRALEQLDD